MAQDLLYQQEVKEAVRQAYEKITTGGGEPVARSLYSPEQLSRVPPGAIEWALGVGNPSRTPSYGRARRCWTSGPAAG